MRRDALHMVDEQFFISRRVVLRRDRDKNFRFVQVFIDFPSRRGARVEEFYSQ